MLSTEQFLDVVQEVERDFGLPAPKLGGQWAKKSRAVQTSYLFTDPTEANADETIRFAKLGGFEYIMTYDSTWAKSLGSYPIDTNNFPGGEASLKATVDKCHAAGLKVGLHFLTSFVGKNDPELVVGDKTLAIPRELRTGDYVESWANGPMRVFDRNGVLLSSLSPEGDWPLLQAGVNRVVLRAAGAGCARLTAITVGEAVSW
jgi:hypothetical protein